MANDPYELTDRARDNAYFGGHPSVREPGSVAYRARKHLRRLIGDPELETAAEEAGEKKKDDEGAEYGIFKGMSGYDKVKK